MSDAEDNGAELARALRLVSPAQAVLLPEELAEHIRRWRVEVLHVRLGRSKPRERLRSVKYEVQESDFNCIMTMVAALIDHTDDQFFVVAHGGPRDLTAALVVRGAVCAVVRHMLERVGVVGVWSLSRLGKFLFCAGDEGPNGPVFYAEADGCMFDVLSTVASGWKGVFYR